VGALPAPGPEGAQGDVGLGAVGRDPGDRSPGVTGHLQVVNGPDAGQQQDGDLGATERGQGEYIPASWRLPDPDSKNLPRVGNLAASVGRGAFPGTRANGRDCG